MSKRLEDLNRIIKGLEDRLEPLQKERRELLRKVEEKINLKIDLTHRLKDKFLPEDLIFSADSTCTCKAGLAYPKGIGVSGSWHCSAILMGEADIKVKHIPRMPFSFYNIKSEGQPSADGRTTRPKKDV